MNARTEDTTEVGPNYKILPLHSAMAHGAIEKTQINYIEEKMGDQIVAVSTAELSQSKKQEIKPSLPRLKWVPTSTDHIIAAEKRLLSLVK
jgi:hypothetical protein